VAALLTVLTDPHDPSARRALTLTPGVSILKAAQAAGVDITATCGGRGRCTSCRVKFVAGAIPPPSIMDEVQLGADQVREGYRLSCQCRPGEPVTVQVAPPIEELSFQMLGAADRTGSLGRVTIDSGVDKARHDGAPARRASPDLRFELLAVVGARSDVGQGARPPAPGLRDDPAGTTVTTFDGDHRRRAR
jgi:ferredoxin